MALPSILLITLLDRPPQGYFSYYTAWKEIIPDSSNIFDLDSFSDTSLFQYAANFVIESSPLLIIDASLSQSPSKITGLLNQVLKSKTKLTSVLIGEQQIIEKMLRKISASNFYKFKEKTEIQGLISV